MAILDLQDYRIQQCDVMRNTLIFLLFTRYSPPMFFFKNCFQFNFQICKKKYIATMLQQVSKSPTPTAEIKQLRFTSDECFVLTYPLIPCPILTLQLCSPCSEDMGYVMSGVVYHPPSFQVTRVLCFRVVE